MTAGDPNADPQSTNPAKKAPANTGAPASADDSAAGTGGVELTKKKGILGKALDFMPAWAWILSLGLILAILVAAGAVLSMNSTEVSKGGAGSKPSQVTASYPEATTSGTWTQSQTPDPVPYYDPGYQQDYGYTAPESSTEESTAEESSRPSSAPHESERPEPRPSSRPQPSQNPQPEQPQPTQPGNGGGTPGNGDGNGGTAPTDAPLEPTQ